MKNSTKPPVQPICINCRFSSQVVRTHAIKCSKTHRWVAYGFSCPFFVAKSVA